MGEGGGHFFLGDDQAGVEVAAGDVIPAGDQSENAGAAADVGSHIGFAPGAGAVGQVFAVHVDAVKGFGGGDGYDAVDVGDGEAGVVEGGGGALKGEFFGGFLSAAHKFGQAGAEDGDFVLVGHCG